VPDPPSRPDRASDSSSSHVLEIAHVLFMDIVGYSKLPMDEQEKLLMQLQDAVRLTPEFSRAQTTDELIRLPTGDGMVLVFFRDPESPVRCALELGRALRGNPEMKLRMGIHSGPVYRVPDINASRNVAGGGINMAQRVMDCGDAGHILVSEEAAKILTELSAWKGSLQDLGHAEVKHGLRIHLFNLFTQDAGNSERPQKLCAAESRARAARSDRRLRIVLPVAAIVVLGLSFGGWLYHARRTHALSETDTIVLADFANTTGDNVFDDTLKQALATELQQSPFLNILPDRKVNATLKLMGRTGDIHLDEETAIDLCQRTGSKAVMSGSIASLGSQYAIGLNAVNCQTGDSLAREAVQASKKEDVLNALDKAATKLREKVGESLSSIQKFDTPLEQATTPSLEALKAFSLAKKTQYVKGDAATVPIYNRAIELDPNFAAAYASLGAAYSNLNEPTLASENLRKAFDLRERVSEREKLRISAFYYTHVTGELEKANQTYELWAQAYPRDVVPPGNLAVNYASLGQYEKSVTQTLEALRLDPDNGVAYSNLVADYLSLNRLDEAKAAYQKAIARKLDFPSLHLNLYGVAFLQGDSAEMDRQAAWAAGKPGVQDWLFSIASDTEAYSGRLASARELSGRAAEFAQRAGQKETAALWRMNAALREAEFGNPDQARQETAVALALASTHDTQILAALAAARAGDSGQAERMADVLAKQYPLDTVVNGYWLPTIRAGIEINRHNPAKAIGFLQVAAPYEVGLAPPGPEVGAFLYPVYVRGQAYLLLNKGSEAEAEFQKFSDHRGLVVNCPLGALAHLGLARAYAQQSDKDKARSAYQDFLRMWKDADPGIPILRYAKFEYAKLE
jgi:eukaryotic-like serine/threonine-protein kinase